MIQMILEVSHVSKAFNGDEVLKDVTFHINEHSKTALVGKNGCGKSTIIKMLAGEYSPDSGSIILKKDTTTGFVMQNQTFDSDRTIYDEMLAARQDILELEKKLSDINDEINLLSDGHTNTASSSSLDSLIKLQARLHEEFDKKNGYALRSEAAGILKGLGFKETDFSRPCYDLSGGEKTRIALGRMLMNSPDLIVLDEPTNHLDMNSINFLEGYLSGYRGTVIIVAHDRYFLNRIVNNVIEISNGTAHEYKGNYDDFSYKKAQLMETRMREYLKQQKEISHQEQVITTLRRFNREKSIKRAESREKALNKIELIEKPLDDNAEMSLKFTPRIAGGNDVLTVKGLKKSFPGKELFDDISFDIHKGERIAIIGDNGTGKTTILKIINGLESADAGTIRTGTDIYPGYFDQAHQVLDPLKTIFDEIHDDYPDLTNTRIRNLLASFLFTGDGVYKVIGSLSGGEQSRVSLCKLMLSDANFLMLDEPTNHLDIESREILEHALVNYEGTVLFVSHDRYFINKVSTGILNLTHHKLLRYIGNYDYYLEKKEDTERANGITDALSDSAISQVNAGGHLLSAAHTGNDIYSAPSVNNAQDPMDGPVSASKDMDNHAAGPMNSALDTTVSYSPERPLTYAQEKELKNKLKKLNASLAGKEKEISECEEKSHELEEFMADPANGTDTAGLYNAQKEYDALDEKLLTLMEEWDELSGQIKELMG
jgi:ATP-binding cassette subfamily F protein 3